MRRAHFDELFMLECLALAHRGAGMVSPNPMVGCVIVKNGKVIGRGYHKRFGGPHAEVEAIRSARGSVRGATLYVNLEPCNFHGKTPPCTDLIIRSGIARVVAMSGCPGPPGGAAGADLLGAMLRAARLLAAACFLVLCLASIVRTLVTSVACIASPAFTDPKLIVGRPAAVSTAFVASRSSCK